MERITKQDVMVQLSGVNQILESMGATYRMQYNGRYNYYVIERILLSNNLPLHDPLVSGTQRECYNYAVALLRGFWMARGEY
jgi:hypothetical protein